MNLWPIEAKGFMCVSFEKETPSSQIECQAHCLTKPAQVCVGIAYTPEGNACHLCKNDDLRTHIAFSFYRREGIK